MHVIQFSQDQIVKREKESSIKSEMKKSEI